MSALWNEDNGQRLVVGQVQSIDDGAAMVKIPSFDDGLNLFGPCPVPAGASEGDACLVAFDENDLAWVVSAGGGGALSLAVEEAADDISALQSKNSRVFPFVIDLYGPQSQEAFSLVGPSTTTYIFPGSALSSSTFEFYQYMTPIVRYAVWQVVWTPVNTGVGIRLVKFDAGPSGITQISEITGKTGGPRNDSEDVTAAMQAIMAGLVAAPPGVHKQIGHQLKGDGSTGAKVYMSRVSMLLQV